MQRPGKFSTAPARLNKNKRDVPAIWDLFDTQKDSANDDSPSTVDTELLFSATREPSVSRRTSFSSVTSEGSEALASLEAGGSWPRIRKQRTGESRSMSLFDVTEAFEQQHLSPERGPAHAYTGPYDGVSDIDMSNLDALVKVEKEAATDEGSSSVSVESFVDAVFKGIAPTAESAARPGPASAPASVANVTPKPSPPLAPAPAPKSGRAPTANDLALLEAIAADEAAAAAAQRAATAAAARDR